MKTEFTKPECDRFRELCNFTDEELLIFNLRVKDMTIIQIQQELADKNKNMSEATINRRIRNIKKKICKVL